MKIMNIMSAVLLCTTLLGTTSTQAETIKRGMIGCISEDLLDELLTYVNKRDQSGMMQLIISGKCMLLKVGDSVSVISPGLMTATIRYKGIKLYTPTEAIR